MSNLLKVSDDLQQQMLFDLCARNQSSELVCNSSDGKNIRAKVRFLHLSGQRLFIDLPTVSGRVVMIRPNEIIQLYFLWKGQRFVATSIILARVKLQDGKSNALDALAIQYPYEIERAQRRECYRLSLTHLPSAGISLSWADDLNDDDPPAKLRKIPSTTTDNIPSGQSGEEASDQTAEAIVENPDQNTAKPEDTPPLKELRGRMVNLSETGCLAVFDKKDAPSFKQGHFYNAEFLLPNQPDAFAMSAQIRWSQQHPAGDRVMVGMAWQVDPKDREHKDIQGIIVKFITDEQREALRRARQAD